MAVTLAGLGESFLSVERSVATMSARLLEILTGGVEGYLSEPRLCVRTIFKNLALGVTVRYTNYEGVPHRPYTLD